MSNFSALIATIQAYIRENGNEEITGPVLQDVLEAMVAAMGTVAINNLEAALATEVTNRLNGDGTLQTAINAITTKLGEGCVYAGIATTTTNPGTLTGKVFYIATAAGTYTYFLGSNSQALVLTRGINILSFNGTAWSVEQVIAISDEEDFIEPDAQKRAKIPTVGALADMYGAYEENLEWLKVEKDSDGRVIEGTKREGKKVLFGDVEILGRLDVNGVTGRSLVQTEVANALSAIDNEEFIEIKKDNAGRIILAIRENGELFFGGGVPRQIIDYYKPGLSNLESLIAKTNDSGDYVQHKKSVLGYFDNQDAKALYYRQKGNIWQNWDSVDKVLNPITSWSAPDPSCIKAGDYFYLFRTGKPCYIDRSKDFVNWERGYSQVFPINFNYSTLNYSENVECDDLWACDINYIGGQYVLYITVKPTRGDNTNFYDIVMRYDNSAINPDEWQWVYEGVICPPKSDRGPVTQAVDPEYATDGTNHYLIIGSFFDLVMAKLEPDSLSVVEDGWGEGETWKVIAKGLPESEDYHDHCGEGSYIFKHNDYYYLFVSLGRFAESTYRIAIARSESLENPDFKNKDGESLIVDVELNGEWHAEWNADPTVILYSDEDDILFGPGHNAEIYTDAEGNMYMILHCHVKGLFGDDSARPDIMMRIVEGEDGWPSFADANGNVVTKPTWECSVPQLSVS